MNNELRRVQNLRSFDEKIAILRRALNFYADEYRWSNQDVTRDGGKIARQALDDVDR